MRSEEDLRHVLRRIDGRSYGSYREIRGDFALGALSLHVDHVQADPFASPSKLRLRFPQSHAVFPASLHSNPTRRIATEDFLARRARRWIRREGPDRQGSGKSGVIYVDAGGQQVLERSAVSICKDWVEIRLEVGLPAAGRRARGEQAEMLLCDALPRLAQASLLHENLPHAELLHFVEAIENQEHLRDQLDARGLVAFVGDGALLPRESGASDRPLGEDQAVRFNSPDSLRVELPLLHSISTPDGPRSTIAGMGVPKGVTLIVGGGYHGKSTLLRALERAVYPHLPGDGREWTVSNASLVKVRAEDGRSVAGVDISAFIDDLPQGRSTRCFSSDDASGSTSQAANIIEAIEAGAEGLLLDEDTSATNFMLRDARMQALISKRHEPITPFLERVRALYEEFGISTVLVMGGCGDYFDVADRVIEMREFLPRDVTEEAAKIAALQPSGRHCEATTPLTSATARIPAAESFDPSRGRRSVAVEASGVDRIAFGRETIELRAVEQLVDRSQTRAVGHALHLAAERFMHAGESVSELLDRIDALIDEGGLDELDPRHQPGRHPGNYARPRRFEIAAALNRLRTLRVQQRPESVPS